MNLSPEILAAATRIGQFDTLNYDLGNVKGGHEAKRVAFEFNYTWKDGQMEPHYIDGCTSCNGFYGVKMTKKGNSMKITGELVVKGVDSYIANIEATREPRLAVNTQIQLVMEPSIPAIDVDEDGMKKDNSGSKPTLTLKITGFLDYTDVVSLK